MKKYILMFMFLGAFVVALSGTADASWNYTYNLVGAGGYTAGTPLTNATITIKVRDDQGLFGTSDDVEKAVVEFVDLGDFYEFTGINNNNTTDVTWNHVFSASDFSAFQDGLFSIKVYSVDNDGTMSDYPPASPGNEDFNVVGSSLNFFWGTGFPPPQATIDATGSFPIYLAEEADPRPVPIPGAIWLLGSGLFGLIGLRGRKNKR